MTLSGDEFQERLIDYLYGELEGDELRAFEEHLRTSDAGKRELAALQTTLRIARDGLAQTVDVPAPARVRSAVIEAAAAQLRAAEPLRTTPATRADEPGGFLRWLRAAWLLPTLGVAAAVALMVFGKRVEPPSMQVDEPTASPTQAAPEQSPAAAPPLSAAADESSQAAPKAEQPITAEMPQAPAKASRSNRARTRTQNDGFAEPPPAWDPRRGAASHAHQEPGAAPAAAASGNARESAADDSQLMGDKAATGLGKAGGGRSERRSGAAEQRTSSDTLDGVAAPEAARAAAPVPASAAGVARGSTDTLLDGFESELQRQPADAISARALNDLLRRAAEHVAARRWQQAVAVYRELLRRYPNDPRATAWKKQLVQATQAERSAR